MMGAAALPLAAAGPASADFVRQRQQWVFNSLDVQPAWRITQGRHVIVAVIDSGVDSTVSDLAGSVITGPDLTGVGTPPSNPNWGDHGTWMASLIAGHGHGPGGQDGILGIAPQSKVLSIRVITDRTDPNYAKYEAEPASRGQHELAEAIRYAVNHRAGVISMSLGYDGASVVVRSALQYALSHNVVVVASSGNSGTPQTDGGQGSAPYSFPADYPGVIGVAAVNNLGQPAYFSSENLSVQVAAPGVNVPAEGRGSIYWEVSGTSPACALTAGVAALIKSKYPSLTTEQVRSAITRSSANRPRGGYNDEVGFGTVDAAAALRVAGRLAGQPSGGATKAAKAAAAGNFGGGSSGVPPLPVAPRSNEPLLILFALGAACALLMIFSLWRFGKGIGDGMASRRALRLAGGPPTGLPGQAYSGYAVQPYPSGGPTAPQYPAPGYRGQTYPAPGHPGQAYPGQAYPSQVPPSQPYPGQSYPSQPYPGQGYPGPANPSEGHLGQGYPSRPYPEQGYAGPGYPSHGYPSQPYPGQGYPVPDYPTEGHPAPGYPGQVPPVQGYPNESYLGQSYPGQSYPDQGSPGQADPVQRDPARGQAGFPKHPWSSPAPAERASADAPPDGRDQVAGAD